ncbi:hypothetical protein LUZ60_008738 [Juncus effusus]|nr:hypothetical protein LUZ60_008738 [Juncus effusus]
MQPSHLLSLSFKMKRYSSARNPTLDTTSKLTITLTLLLLTLIFLYFSPPLSPSPSRPLSPPQRKQLLTNTIDSDSNTCDIFRGKWVKNPNAPYYTNETCWAIHDHQNCAKFGRPDAEFLKWRWKPDRCDMPVFNAAQFLELMRGKALAFLGDSVGRNQMQSLMCLLLRVTYAEEVSSKTDEKSTQFFFPTHNFTVANIWSPYLVRSHQADPTGPTRTGLFNLYLDEPDSNWTSRVTNFDHVIVSGGHWFFRPTMYYENNQLSGCHYCLNPEVTDLTMYHGYRMAFKTTFKTFLNLEGFEGNVFLRTFAPSHFENGEWDKGGDCTRRKPFRNNETRLDGINLEFYMIQLEEFREAERVAEKKGIKFNLLDSTEAMLLRPDGHPSRFGHKPNENILMYNDCVHWCLPGPIDVLNDFLLQMLKTERSRSMAARFSRS